MPEALIWGASGGIGTALVTLLKQGGWRVFAAARHLDRIPDAADEHLSFTAQDPDSFKEVNRWLAHESSGIDLVVYAAGDLRAEKLIDLPGEGWDEVLSGNLTGAFLAASHSLNLLKANGHMMFIGAYVDHLLLPEMGAYAAAKGGLEPLVAVLRKENRRQRFSIVRPGAVDTPFWRNAPFRLPADAKSADAVAEAILAHTLAGAADDLNL